MALDGTPVQLIGNVGRDDPHSFTTGSNKPGIGFSIAVQPDYDAEKPDWYDIATTNEGLIAWVKDNIHGGSKAIAVEGTLIEKQGTGKVFRNVWANRIGIIEWGKGTRRGEPAPVASDEEGF